MQFNHRFQEVAVKVQAAEAVVQAAVARRAETLEGHISWTRKAIRVHNILISYNFSRSTTFMKGLRPFGDLKPSSGRRPDDPRRNPRPYSSHRTTRIALKSSSRQPVQQNCGFHSPQRVRTPRLFYIYVTSIPLKREIRDRL